MEVRASDSLTEAEAIELAQRYVGAYMDRDLVAMLALQDEDVVSYPARLFGSGPSIGREGVREWWEAMVASGRWYDVVVREIRQLGPDRVAVLGEIHQEGELLSPWGVIFRVRNGLIIESRSYLSDRDLLESLQVLGESAT